MTTSHDLPAIRQMHVRFPSVLPLEALQIVVLYDRLATILFALVLAMKDKFHPSNNNPFCTHFCLPRNNRMNINITFHDDDDDNGDNDDDDDNSRMTLLAKSSFDYPYNWS